MFRTAVNTVPQVNGNHEEATRKSATSKYLLRIRQVLKSQLGMGRSKSELSTCMPVIRYPAGIITWLKEESEATDIKARKILPMHGGFNPKSSTMRLTLRRGREPGSQ